MFFDPLSQSGRILAACGGEKQFFQSLGVQSSLTVFSYSGGASRPAEINRSICAIDTSTLSLIYSECVCRVCVRSQAEPAEPRRPRPRQGMSSGDDFTAADKVAAPRVCMCRIDYQTRSLTADCTDRDRQQKHCLVLSRQVWLSDTMTVIH